MAKHITLINLHPPSGKIVRPSFSTNVTLRINLLHQFFGHFDQAAEEDLHCVLLYGNFTQFAAGTTRLPDESIIPRFRHMCEQNDLGLRILAKVNAKLIDRGLMLKPGTVFDVTLIAAPNSIKKDKSERDPEMHQTKQSNQLKFGIKY